jgi:hypothetical protein
MADTVPSKITERLLAFCRTVAPTRPRFIPSKPSTDAQPSACFDNTERKVERAGGSLVCGWAIWSLPGVYYEAEHHGVWQNRRGAFIDVSPQINGSRRILFLPDPEAAYDPLSYRSNILQAATNDPLATEFVELANRRNQIQDGYREGGARIALLTCQISANCLGYSCACSTSGTRCSADNPPTDSEWERPIKFRRQCCQAAPEGTASRATAQRET